MWIYLTLPSEPKGSIPSCYLPCHSLGLCSFLEIGNYEVCLTVAVVINYPLVATLLSRGSRNNSCNPCSIVMY
ncbi:hypothetical protein CMV_026723 [Castanea mollissima]|uniref:Uncharacterized protein n=1 Tax=Castanea mollissima TaxID=60419 RepID=A0A8J4VEP1_9ROSI|nr:hypothetical protein CMV_026723 [Castanea mollissima]